MSQKGAFKAAIEGKCPRCREGRMFETGVLSIKFGKMPEHCPKCNLKYEVEPGFWFGAMYISYMISVALFITVFVAVYVLFSDPALEIYILTTVAISFLLYPVNFRISRIIFLHIAGGVKYDPSQSEQ